MKPRVFCLFSILVLALSMAQAQQPAPPPPPPPAGTPGHTGQDPFGHNFYPPEMIMRNQEALQLTDEQQSYFKTELRKTQTSFTELQWKMEDEAEKLVALAKGSKLDEQAVLAQLEKVLTAERDIKRAQISLLVRLKNKLTPAQQAILNNLRHMEALPAAPKPGGE
ncbi:MAG TPA: periplasmic heavy metal sensor [Candidatus Saccharimonadales bacterium]|jgi:Spy/CpxP family protein refolding chaperone|nr:periplasmic heavy metal sensor [Candidatus Saccharimonadales bacterium]